MNSENCPCCPNHCEKDNLRCGKGRDYFNHLSDLEPSTISEKVIEDLRKCGHLLHHNKDIEANEFLSSLTDDELKELHLLLSKIWNHME